MTPAPAQGPATTPGPDVTPSRAPLEVVVGSGPAEWWQVASAWTPLFVLLGAVLAAVVGWRTLRQRTLADALALEQQRTADGRAEWWRRTQWALDHALAKDPSTRALGLVALATLAESELAPVEELKMLDGMLGIVEESSLGAPVNRREEEESAPPMDQDVGNGNMRGVEVMAVPTAASQAGKPAVEENAGPSDAARPAQPPAGGTAAASPQERQVGVAAARLRVTLDRRLDRQTPAAIAAWAQEKL